MSSKSIKAANKNLEPFIVYVLNGSWKLLNRDRVDGITTAVKSRVRVVIWMLKASELDKFGNIIGLGKVDCEISGSIIVLEVKTKEFTNLWLEGNIKIFSSCCLKCASTSGKELK